MTVTASEVSSFKVSKENGPPWLFLVELLNQRGVKVHLLMNVLVDSIPPPPSPYWIIYQRYLPEA